MGERGSPMAAFWEAEDTPSPWPRARDLRHVTGIPCETGERIYRERVCVSVMYTYNVFVKKKKKKLTSINGSRSRNHGTQPHGRPI